MSDPLDLETIERRHRTVAQATGACIRCNQSWPCDANQAVARVRELEAKDARCEAHPFEADDAGCAPCHAVRVRELEAALRPFADIAGVTVGPGTRTLPVEYFWQARAALEGRQA